MRVKVLILCVLTMATIACAEPETVELTSTQPAATVEDLATATKIIPTPTLRPSKTATTAVTATLTPTPTIAITNTPESVTSVELSVAAANMRLGAGTEFAVVGIVGADEEISLLETNLDGSWYKVRTADGREGWIGSTVATLVEN